MLRRRSPPAPSPFQPAAAHTDVRRLPSYERTSGRVFCSKTHTFMNSFRSSSALRTHFYGTNDSRSGKIQLFQGQIELELSTSATLGAMHQDPVPIFMPTKILILRGKACDAALTLLHLPHGPQDLPDYLNRTIGTAFERHTSVDDNLQR